MSDLLGLRQTRAAVEQRPADPSTTIDPTADEIDATPRMVIAAIASTAAIARIAMTMTRKVGPAVRSADLTMAKMPTPISGP
jgi:hypothetical protein